ncbi:DUF554 domain-containing protein [Kamptonema cortianum]|nr:DUF554 domain-containing protein [Kamptonema cortianum]
MKLQAYSGTLLNTGTVIIGSLIGLGVKQVLPDELQITAITGIGLAVIALGIAMFLKHRNVLIIVGSIVCGGIIGSLIGIEAGFEAMAETARSWLGAGGTFSEGLITASVLYCVGPMTVLGCIQNGIEGKSELLGVKSLLDGIASIFLAATLGWGVLLSAVVVLVVQGALTALSGLIKVSENDTEIVDEATATGGLLMLAIGLGLAGIANIPTETYLPALVLAPAIAIFIRRRSRKLGNSSTS